MDWGVLAYVAVASAIALTRVTAFPRIGWVLLAHALVVLLVWLVNRPGLGRFGRTLADVYPLVLVLICYTALDTLSGNGAITTHEQAVQRWEAALFGGQPSREWWQRYPSRFWSTLLHAVYASYYPIIVAGPVLFLWRGDRRGLRRVVTAVAATYAICFLIFLWYPVAGPNYEFPPPAPEFLDNPAARLVYALLARGSSYGAAFPSSHVAAALVASYATWLGSRTLGLLLAVPSVLLVFAVVYTQMHYAIDSLAGVVLAGVVVGGMILLEKRKQRTANGER